MQCVLPWCKVGIHVLYLSFVMPAVFLYIQHTSIQCILIFLCFDHFAFSFSVVKKMKKMRVEEEWVVKVVPDRIFSVQFHPTVEKTLVLVGGKWGQLGEWCWGGG